MQYLKVGIDSPGRIKQKGVNMIENQYWYTFPVNSTY